MHALTGGSLRPGLMRYLSTSHLDALMITSMAMVKASGVLEQLTMILISKCCHAMEYFAVDKHSCISHK